MVRNLTLDGRLTVPVVPITPNVACTSSYATMNSGNFNYETPAIETTDSKLQEKQEWQIINSGQSLTYLQPDSKPMICASADSDPTGGYLLWKNKGSLFP